MDGTGGHTIAVPRGHLGDGALATAVNRLECPEMLPFPRNTAFLRTFIKRHTSQFETLHRNFQGVLCGMRDPNSQQLLQADVEQYLLNNLQLNVESNRFKGIVGGRLRLPPHHDGSRGMLVCAWQLTGDRELRILTKDKSMITIPSGDGHFYLSNIATAYHQVAHAFEGGAADAGPLGSCEIALVARCTFLGHVKAPNSKGLQGRAFSSP